MKKLLLFTMMVLVFACDNDDNEEQQPCTNKLWELVATGDCQQGTECSYLATYGETEANAGTVIVDQDTYDHYAALGNVSDGSLCWEGTQE